MWDRRASAASGWVSLGLVTTQLAEAVSQVLREEGLQVVTREDLDGITLSGRLRTEVYVPSSEEMRAREIVAGWQSSMPEPPVGSHDPDAAGTDDESEAAMGWLGKLFDASDCLRRHPRNTKAIDELTQAASAVLAGGPPYGVEPTYWAQVGRAGGHLRDLAKAGAASDVVKGAAATVCDLVRDHV